MNAIFTENLCLIIIIVTTETNDAYEAAGISKSQQCQTIDFPRSLEKRDGNKETLERPAFYQKQVKLIISESGVLLLLLYHYQHYCCCCCRLVISLAKAWKTFAKSMIIEDITVLLINTEDSAFLFLQG